MLAEVGLAESEDIPPYRRLTAVYRTALSEGTLVPGAAFPTVKVIAAAHDVSVGTAHRVVAALTAEGLTTTRRGVRATIVGVEEALKSELPEPLQ